MKIFLHYLYDKASPFGWKEWMETETGEKIENVMVLEALDAKNDDEIMVTLIMKKADAVKE